MAQAQATSVSLGDFDTTSTINYIDNRIRTELFSERISLDNLEQVDITLRADATSNPIDFRKAYVRIYGTVNGTGRAVRLSPFALFNMFESATLKINGQIIETITDFAMNEQLLALLSKSAFELNNGTAEEGSAFTIPLGVNNVVCAAGGTYSPGARSHLLGASTADTDIAAGTFPFELTLNLSDIFLSIRTMQAVYKRMNIEVLFKRRPRTDNNKTGIGCKPIANINAPDVGADAVALTATTYKLDQVSLVYSEYLLSNTIDDNNNKQYEQDYIALPYLAMECAKEPVTGRIFSKQLNLKTSKFGNECLVIAFTKQTQDAPNFRPLELLPLDLTKLIITVGGNKIFDANDLTAGQYRRLYEKFRASKNLFLSDQSQAISYQQWQEQYPILAFDLNAFANTDKMSGIQNINIYLERDAVAAVATPNLSMYVNLVTDQAKSIKPSTMTVVGDLEEKKK